ncbi:MAG: winged helix-turn-helix domain-containing protein [Clostridia bacterium]|nr:winged helix-turn-helix domain-containing protein [Clostridia bacterium]
MEELIKNPQLKAADLSLIINKSKRTVERYLKSLQKNGYIERAGSDKTGGWKVIK